MLMPVEVDEVVVVLSCSQDSGQSIKRHMLSYWVVEETC